MSEELKNYQNNLISSADLLIKVFEDSLNTKGIHLGPKECYHLINTLKNYQKAFIRVE